jgi:hypothetical protein
MTRYSYIHTFLLWKHFPCALSSKAHYCVRTDTVEQELQKNKTKNMKTERIDAVPFKQANRGPTYINMLLTNRPQGPISRSSQEVYSNIVYTSSSRSFSQDVVSCFL